jgi:phage terminase large subunit-like protein
LLRGGVCWWLAPTYAMAESVWVDLQRAAASLPGLRIQRQQRTLRLPNGGSIAIKSTHEPDHLRGAGLDFVVLDEAAFMPPSLWPEVVQPMLLDRKGRALMLSSPNGRNWFYHAHQMGVTRRRSWRSFHFTSYDNPYLDPAELDSIRTQVPERIWREEYLAEFLDDLGQVFRGITAAATAPLAATPQPGRRYVAGLDWGRESDYTAIVILDAESKAVVAIDRFNGLAWSLQRARLTALAERWSLAVIWAESNSIGGPNIEALQQAGLPVQAFATTARSKPDLIESLALAIEQAHIALLPDDALLGELAAYRLERLPAGGYRYSAPDGLHDDLVIALALAWHAVRFAAPSIAFA